MTMQKAKKFQLPRLGWVFVLSAASFLAGAALPGGSEPEGAGPREGPEATKRLVTAMCAEASAVAEALGLDEALPITPKTAAGFTIAPPELSKMLGSVGTVSSSNYLYAISRGARLCYIERLKRGKLNKALSELSTNNVTTPERQWAYAVATQYLTKLSVDVKALDKIAVARVERDAPDPKAPGVWIVWWPRPQAGSGALASVRFVGEGKPLFDIRVEDPAYLQRAPISGL